MEQKFKSLQAYLKLYGDEGTLSQQISDHLASAIDQLNDVDIDLFEIPYFNVSYKAGPINESQIFKALCQFIRDFESSTCRETFKAYFTVDPEFGGRELLDIKLIIVNLECEIDDGLEITIDEDDNEEYTDRDY